jgi:hypothetical protein
MDCGGYSRIHKVTFDFFLTFTPRNLSGESWNGTGKLIWCQKPICFRRDCPKQLHYLSRNNSIGGSLLHKCVSSSHLFSPPRVALSSEADGVSSKAMQIAHTANKSTFVRQWESSSFHLSALPLDRKIVAFDLIARSVHSVCARPKTIYPVQDTNAACWRFSLKFLPDECEREGEMNSSQKRLWSPVSEKGPAPGILDARSWICCRRASAIHDPLVTCGTWLAKIFRDIVKRWIARSVVTRANAISFHPCLLEFFSE